MIGKLLGHTQVQTTARYAHLAADPVKAVACIGSSKSERATSYRRRIRNWEFGGPVFRDGAADPSTTVRRTSEWRAGFFFASRVGRTERNGRHAERHRARLCTAGAKRTAVGKLGRVRGDGSVAQQVQQLLDGGRDGATWLAAIPRCLVCRAQRRGRVAPRLPRCATPTFRRNSRQTRVRAAPGYER